MPCSVHAELLGEAVQANPVWIALTGVSMSPYLDSGSRLCAAHPALDRVRPGALLVYSEGTNVVCHRVLRRRRRERLVFLMKGDRPGTLPAWVDAERVVATVVALERRGCRVSLMTRRARVRARLTAGVILLRVWSAPFLALPRRLRMRTLGWARAS